MKVKIKLLKILCFVFMYSYAQNWELIWEDNFNGNNLDESKWVHELGTGSQNGLYGWGNNELQYYQPENTTVSNGTLKITAQEEPSGIQDPVFTWNTLNYSSSRIKTDGLFTFRYGKIQARIKTVDGQGFWPAFWMLPSGGSWPCDGEIDIMEQWGNDGNTNISTGAAHVGSCPFVASEHMYNSFQHPIEEGSYADEFHTYEVRWYEDYIAWYIDDQYIHHITPSSYPNQYNWPFNDMQWYIILNFAITSSGPNANTTLPSFIEVDWVRVYQEDGTSGCTDSLAYNFNIDASIDNGSCLYEVNFVLDLNCSGIYPTSVNATSSNDNWSCDGGISLNDDDQDGVWEATSYMAQGLYSYVYCADNWTYSEDILNYAQTSNDWSCTPNTDYTNYANRQINILGPITIHETWGTCQPCNGDIEIYGCTDSEAINYNLNATIDNGTCDYTEILNITVDVCSNASEVRLTGPWWSWNIYGGPIATTNNDGTWTFTIDPAPTENMEYLIVVDGVQENLVEYGTSNNDWSCTPITDYFNYANRLWEVGNYDESIVYGTCENTCDSQEEYFATVNFTVDMNHVNQPSIQYNNVVINGSWNGWNGWGIILNDDNNDGIYEGSTELLANSSFEYVVAVTGAADNWSGWGMQWGNGCNNQNGQVNTSYPGSNNSTYLIAGCPPDVIYGCMDTTATNFNSQATIDDNSCIFNCLPSWEVIVTDQNHSIFIDGSYTDFEGNPISSGSLIGVFYINSENELACAGYSLLNENATQISVMGDDSSTPEIDGLINGENFYYKIWDINDCSVYDAEVSYSSGSNYYITNGISFIDSIYYTPITHQQSINLNQGWSIFSTYIQAENSEIPVLLEPIIDHVIIVKDNLGLAYIPNWDFNGIGDLTIGQGYQIKVDSVVEILISGTILVPEDNPIFLTEGWNMIAYLRLNPSSCDLVFESLTNSNQLVIVKDSDGYAYLPEWDFNGIGMMQSGRGYQVKMLSPANLEYLPNDEDYE